MRHLIIEKINIRAINIQKNVQYYTYFKNTNETIG